MFSHLERPGHSPPGWRQLLVDFGPTYAANGFIGFVFAATAPVAIILSVGTRGRLSESELASWIFGVFFVNGLISILFCWLYRTTSGRHEATSQEGHRLQTPVYKDGRCCVDRLSPQPGSRPSASSPRSPRSGQSRLLQVAGG
jgi:hypothetical protein